MIFCYFCFYRIYRTNDTLTRPLSITVPELASNGGSVIDMFHPVHRDVALDDWDENRRQQLTASAIRALERYHDLDIAVTRVRSPRDFRDGMNLYGGAVYGLSPASGQMEYFAHTGTGTLSGWAVHLPRLWCGCFRDVRNLRRRALCRDRPAERM